MSMKNPLTPAGIEPATFRFVAQHLNHCATAVPSYLVQILFNVILLYMHQSLCGFISLLSHVCHVAHLFHLWIIITGIHLVFGMVKASVMSWIEPLAYMGEMKNGGAVCTVEGKNEIDSKEIM